MRKLKLGRIENNNDIHLLQHTVIPNTDVTEFNVQVNPKIEELRRSNRTRTHISVLCGSE